MWRFPAFPNVVHGDVNSETFMAPSGELVSERTFDLNVNNNLVFASSSNLQVQGFFADISVSAHFPIIVTKPEGK